MYTQANLDENYWNDRYKANETGWDIGHASPALIDYCAGLQSKETAILIPGCGYGHEVVELIAMGFKNLTVIDLSEEALEKLKLMIGDKARMIKGDFFELKGQFDLVIEQTFFCAIDPALRKQYVRKVHDLLKPGGRLMGLLFNRSFEGGPPFGGSKTEYEKLFSGLFKIKKMELCYNSIKPREGTELFTEMVKI